MALFDKLFTNIFTDGEIPGYNPDADGDWFYISDYGTDHNFIEARLVDLLKSLSDLPTNEYRILFGGVVTDGGGGTIDISEGVAIGKDNAGNKRIIHIPALTAVTLPAGWNDNRQIWVIGKYDYKLGAATRNHYSGPAYHYTLEDTYYGDINGYDTPTGSDDLFVDADPGATVVCWGSFQMTGGGVFTDLSVGERSDTYIIAEADHANTADSATNADTVDSAHAGNAAGNVALSNGTVCSTLNADQVDGADLSTDGTFAADSDALIPSQKAAKTYIDASVGGSLKGGIQVYTAGAGNFVVPAGVYKIKVSCTGGGAWGTAAPGSYSGGVGGGAGGTAIKYFTVTPAQVIAYSVGAAGANSTFSTITGNGGAIGTSGGNPGLGGIAIGGDLNLIGGDAEGGDQNDPGEAAPALTMCGGGGGASFWGGGGRGGADGVNGAAGRAYGSGGGGGGRLAAAGGSGGAGCSGVIVIEW